MATSVAVGAVKTAQGTAETSENNSSSPASASALTPATGIEAAAIHTEVANLPNTPLDQAMVDEPNVVSDNESSQELHQEGEVQSIDSHEAFWNSLFSEDFDVNVAISAANAAAADERDPNNAITTTTTTTYAATDAATDAATIAATIAVAAQATTTTAPSNKDLLKVVHAVFTHIAANSSEHQISECGDSLSVDDPFDDGDDSIDDDDDGESSSNDYESSEADDEDSEEEDSSDEESSMDEDRSVHTAEFRWERNITKPFFGSRPFQHDLLEAKFPFLRNDESAIVAVGSEWDSFLYCGRRLGRTAIPQSDGRCGPSNGPQCASCQRLQTNGKYKILELIFPSLDRNILTAALRIRGGNAFAACQYLESFEDIPKVPFEIAFSGSRPNGIPEPCYPVSDTDAQNVVAFFDGSISMATAKMALRRNEHNLEQAVTYILDKSPVQLAIETAEEVRKVTEYEDAVLQFQLKRRESIQDVANQMSCPSVIPQELKELAIKMVPEMDLTKVIASAMEDGHGMVRPTESVTCTACSLSIGTKHAGSQYCPQCNHCEGCIRTKVVYKCPRMGNGGHLHHCPLQPMKIGPARKGYICDIDGEGCLHSENHNLSYYCQDCNFDVCAVCISKPAPVFYHRRLGRMMQFSDDEDEDDDVMSIIMDMEEEEEEDEEDEDAEEQETAPSLDSESEVAEDFAFRPEPAGAPVEANEEPETSSHIIMADKSLEPDTSDALNKEGAKAQKVVSEYTAPAEADTGSISVDEDSTPVQVEDGPDSVEVSATGLSAAALAAPATPSQDQQDTVHESTPRAADERSEEVVLEDQGESEQVSGTEEITAVPANSDGNAVATGQNIQSTGGENTTEGSNEDPKESQPTFDLHERIAASRWGATEVEENNQVDVIIGSGDVRTMERRLKRKQSSDSEEAPVIRHNRPETLLTSKYATALQNYISKETPAASNVHHVESLLHIAQGNEKCCPSDAICQAVGAGKMGIAGTCLLAPMYGGKRKKEDEMKCFCGDPVDSKTAPDGAVGCLNGHALHPSCAADYLLSGGNCPTCREPLFFPKVGKAEADAAEEYLEAELQRRRKEEEEAIRKEQLANGQVFNINDIVRISSDVALCKKELMASPGKTGWISEMDSFCGSMGRITEVEEGKVTIQNQELQHTYFMPQTVVLCNGCTGKVGSKDGEPAEDASNIGLCIFCNQCSKCCSGDSLTCGRSSVKLNWTPSTVSLIGRASSAALWDKSLVDKDLATAAAAEQHIIRLRAEMNAVASARVSVEDSLGNRKGAPSIKVLDGLKEAVSAFDFERARHLLNLMEHWGASPAMMKEKKAIMETLRKGDVDTAARQIRHHNAALVQDDAKWRYAASDHHEYVVESWAKVDLVAWPSLSAPRTGYCLGPSARFQSKQEKLGDDGNVWLLVDEKSLILPQFVNGQPVTADPKDPYAYKNLVGCQVIPGPNWNNDSVEGVGTITAVTGSSIRVKFPRCDSHSWYYPTKDNAGDLLFANPPAPQGWLCMTPRQVPVVRRGRDALQCFACGDGLVSEDTTSRESIRMVQKEEEVKVGQTLLVAATLEPVQVKSVDDEHVQCSFANEDSVHSVCVTFRRDDLLHLCSATKNTEETVTIDGRESGRLDLFRKYGSITDAKAAWNAVKSSNGNSSDTALLSSTYASCVKGHLLHARCFQEALLAGRKCPATGCNEPLWAPKVKRLQREDDACCGGSSETTTVEAADDANLSGMEAVARARNENEEVDYHMDRELKMCPACFSGPLLNQNCNDMEAHHGQCIHHAFENDDEEPCYYCADAKDIASSLMQLSGDKKVVDVLPRCPTHNCVIMFSGCMVCGHLFNETNWSDMPKWDPCAKTLLDVDRKKRKAAASLVSEITREAALLEYERDAVHNFWATTNNEEDNIDEFQLPPLPPPAMGFSDAISESDSDSDEDSDY
ncbi:MAG: hypothetical protein SGBAC_008085 [Bacillariaceae sp.]